MNTLKNNNADDRGIAMDIDGGHRRDVERNNIRYNAMQVVLGFLIIAISAIYIPASAANEQVSNEEDRSQVDSKPGNLAEYAVQQINTIKDENISISGITEEIFDPTERSAVQQAGMGSWDRSWRPRFMRLRYWAWARASPALSRSPRACSAAARIRSPSTCC